MSRVLILGHDQALVDILATGLESSPAVQSCRTARLDLETFPNEGKCKNVEVCVVTAPELRGFPDVETVARACARLRQASHVVLISSAAVHEPSHHHTGLVGEEPLRALRRSPDRGRGRVDGTGNALTACWRELEDRVQKALADAPALLTILRPTALLVPGGRGFWSRFFSGRVAFTLAGFDPTLQVLPVADLAVAIRRMIEARDVEARDVEARKHTSDEVFHVAPTGIPLSKALRAARILRLPVPYVVQRLARRLLAPLGAAPACQLDYLRYSWTVSGEKLRRRFGIDPPSSPWPGKHDDFGLDRGYVAGLGRTLFRFLHDIWWRIEWTGLDNVPRQGRAVLVGVHRGHQPWDGVMTLHLLHRELGRCPRFLIHPALVKFPFLAPYMTKCGGLLACRENAGQILERGEILGIFPEGIRGAFSMYRDSYKLGRFGRDEFVKMALRHQSPLIPYVTIGSAEIFPIYAKLHWRWWKRYSEWPCLPITPTMSTVPLPSKWHTWFLEPIHVDERYPPEAADDPVIVRAISQEVREQMERAMAEMLRRRKSVFFGSIFKEQGRPALEGKTA